jgi:hypothetical protein
MVSRELCNLRSELHVDQRVTDALRQHRQIVAGFGEQPTLIRVVVRGGAAEDNARASGQHVRPSD